LFLLVGFVPLVEDPAGPDSGNRDCDDQNNLNFLLHGFFSATLRLVDVSAFTFQLNYKSRLSRSSAAAHLG
jgi:hypothetical protein